MVIISQKAVKHDFIGPLDRNQRKNLRSFEYFLCKTNPIQTQTKPISNAPLHKQCDLLHLKGSFVMRHLGRYWQTKPKVSDELT